MYVTSTENVGKIFGHVAAIAGMVVGRVCGLSLLIPGALSLASYTVLDKTVGGKARPVVLPLAILHGHLLWVCLGGLIMNNSFITGIHAGILVALTAGLLCFPGRASIGVAGLFTMYWLYDNACVVSYGVTPGLVGAMLAHVLFNGATLVTLFTANSAINAGEAA